MMMVNFNQDMAINSDSYNKIRIQEEHKMLLNRSYWRGFNITIPSPKDLLIELDNSTWIFHSE